MCEYLQPHLSCAINGIFLFPGSPLQTAMTLDACDVGSVFVSKGSIYNMY